MYGGRAPKGELCNKVCMYVCKKGLALGLNLKLFFFKTLKWSFEGPVGERDY